MKHFLTSCLILSVSVLYSQGKITHQNKLTGKYIIVPGTRVYVQVPKGYIQAGDFSGFQKNKKTGISVSDLPGSNYFETSETFSKKELERMGMKVQEFTEMSMDGFSAKFIQAEGANGICEYSIIMGDSSFSTVLIGLYACEDTLSGTELKNTLLSVVYDKSRKIDPFETVPFKVDERASVFKFAKHAGNSFTFSLGGVKRTDYGQEAFMLFMILPADSSKTLRTSSEETVVKLQQYGMLNFEIRNPDTSLVNGLPAYECEVTGYIRGEKSLTYLLVVQLNKNEIVLIEGIAKNEFGNNLSEMKKLSHTIQRKQ
jgi:hypothetical protein